MPDLCEKCEIIPKDFEISHLKVSHFSHFSHGPPSMFHAIPHYYGGSMSSEPGKSGLGGILDTFWYGTEDFGETGPEMEIPGSDLAFGRCQV